MRRNKLIAVRTDVSMKGCRLCLSLYDTKAVYESTTLRIDGGSFFSDNRHEYEKNDKLYSNEHGERS